MKKTVVLAFLVLSCLAAFSAAAAETAGSAGSSQAPAEPQIVVKLTGANKQQFTVAGTRRQIEDYAERFKNKGDYNYAIGCYQQLIATDSRDVRSYVLLGKLYQFQLGKYADAIRQYKKAERVVPPDNPDGLAEIRLFSAKAYQTLAEQTNSLIYFVQAISEYEKVLDHNPKDVEAMFNLASCRLNSKDYDESIRWFERVIELEPEGEWAELSKKALNMAREDARSRSSFKRRTRNS